LTFTNTFPELNHNEILGWTGADKLGVARYVGVLLEDGSESEKMKARASFTEKLIGGLCPFEHVKAQGNTLLQKMLSLAYFGDFVSIYLARLNGVDPEVIDWLVQLKGELAQID
jgi:glucose/mannose-6-phosphate isomerase